MQDDSAQEEVSHQKLVVNACGTCAAETASLLVTTLGAEVPMGSRIQHWMRNDGWRMVAVLALFLVLGPPGHPLASLHAHAVADGARPQQTQEWTSSGSSHL